MVRGWAEDAGAGGGGGEQLGQRKLGGRATADWLGCGPSATVWPRAPGPD